MILGGFGRDSEGLVHKFFQLYSVCCMVHMQDMLHRLHIFAIAFICYTVDGYWRHTQFFGHPEIWLSSLEPAPGPFWKSLIFISFIDGLGRPWKLAKSLQFLRAQWPYKGNPYRVNLCEPMWTYPEIGSRGKDPYRVNLCEPKLQNMKI